MGIKMRKCKFCSFEGEDIRFASAGKGTYKNICKVCNNSKKKERSIKKHRVKQGVIKNQS